MECYNFLESRIVGNLIEDYNILEADSSAYDTVEKLDAMAQAFYGDLYLEPAANILTDYVKDRDINKEYTIKCLKEIFRADSYIKGTFDERYGDNDISDKFTNMVVRNLNEKGIPITAEHFEQAYKLEGDARDEFVAQTAKEAISVQKSAEKANER